MRLDRAAAYGCAAVIVLLALTTGPHVGLYSVPAGGMGGNGPALGSGSADVTVLEAPERAELEAGEYGDVHYLSVPPVSVRTANVTGAPLLTASIGVDDLGFSRSSVFTLQPGDRQTREITTDRVALENETIERSTYDAHLQLVVRDDEGKRTVYDEPIVVEVVE